MEKLQIHDPCIKIKLKFKVSNMNIPLAEIREDEDLNWYISVKKKTTLRINLLKIKLPTIHMMRDTSF